ncbi:PAS domain S-box protein [Nitrospirillum amazonense]|uniref:PAS domain S-box protein n=1 Tax=Nitrospirillum amazonense TaxID=28077 RepID=UPI002412C4D8|nr:PAS domain S-box protein [Nitrospirillum amazonense]MDG3441575.1 PAS domain S-box protein [Nitrospirillum amazonense]
MEALSPHAILAAIVDSSDDAIISKTLDGTVTSWNAAAERLFGYTADEMIGRNIAVLAPPGREAEMPSILARLKQGERVSHFETLRRHKDGHTLEISLTVSPLRDADGNLIGASKIARDISQYRRSERQISFLMQEVDHRAKNALAVVQSILRLTRAESVDDFVALVEGRISALAAIHSQVASRQWVGTDMDSLAHISFDPFDPSGARVTRSGPQTVLGPQASQALGLALYELAGNAARYGALNHPDGHVDLSWQSDDNALSVNWREWGLHDIRPPMRKGFGLTVCQLLLAGQLGGRLDFDWQEGGLALGISLPRANLLN